MLARGRVQGWYPFRDSVICASDSRGPVEMKYITANGFTTSDARRKLILIEEQENTNNVLFPSFERTLEYERSVQTRITNPVPLYGQHSSTSPARCPYFTSTPNKTNVICICCVLVSPG
jgi:hypothetical protein